MAKEAQQPRPVPDVVACDDGRQRCWWFRDHPEYIDCHDTEWAFMQSVGIVNDRVEGCHFHGVVEKRRGAVPEALLILTGH